MAFVQILKGLTFTLPVPVTLVVTLVGLAVVHLWQISRRQRKLGEKIPGPPALPLLGNAHLFINTSPEEIFTKAKSLADKYGHVFRTWVGHKLVVYLSDPRDVELVIGSNVHNEKSDEYKYLKPLVGDGLLLSSGEKWQDQRKMVEPAFNTSTVKRFMPQFNDNAKHLVSRLAKEVGKEFDCHNHMSETVVDMLFEAVLGSNKAKAYKGGFKYSSAVIKTCEVFHKRHFQVLTRYEPFYTLSGLRKQQDELLETIHGVTGQIIKEKQESFSDHSNDESDIDEKRPSAFLDLMMENLNSNSKSLSAEQLKQQVNTIMFQGQDSTAACASFAMCVLGVHQDIQEKVMKEQRAIFGDSDREATFADTIEMKYLERVIMETLRLYPPVPIIARKINKDLKLVSMNVTLPADSTVVIGTYNIQRRADLWENPEQFDPDNFLPERAAARHYYSYIPFSAGPRSCVGRKYAMLKLKVLLSTLLRNFHVTSTVEEKDFKLQADIILKRADGFRIKLEPRLAF